MIIRIFSERAALEASKRAAADAQIAAQKAQVLLFARMIMTAINDCPPKK
jgi:hypothetical protein